MNRSFRHLCKPILFGNVARMASKNGSRLPLPKVSSFVCDREWERFNFDEIILAFVWKEGSRSGVAFEFAGNKSDSCQLSTSERHTPRRTSARQQTWTCRWRCSGNGFPFPCGINCFHKVVFYKAT